MGSNPGSDETVFFSPKRPDWLWVSPSLPFNGCRSYFTGIKRPGRDEHSIPFSVVVKNGVTLLLPSYAPSWCGQRKLPFFFTNVYTD